MNAEQAAIKRATLAAQKVMDQLDASALDELELLYRQAADEIKARISSFAGGDGGVSLANLQDLLAQVNMQLQQLSAQRDALLNFTAASAADLGTQPLESALDLSARMRISGEALAFVRTFVAADGLQLSDRIWRLDRHAREAVTGAIEQAVIQGHGAAQAALEFLGRGQPVPLDVQAKKGTGNAARIAKDAAGALLTGDGSPMDNALRLFRTEINRAHGEAYIKSALSHPDAAGVRFLLSPAHPKPDICDLHASANLHGLGPGVYPSREKCPWPAHPNTLSYVEVVFKDEITASDKAGKETPLQALQRLTPAQRIGALGANKARAFDEGLLTQAMIKTPWKAVQRRLGKVIVRPPKLPPAPRNLSLDDMLSAGSEIADGLLAQARTRHGYHGPTLLEAIHRELNAIRSTETPARVANTGKATQLVQAASRLFPDEWTRAADRYGPLTTKFSASRGLHYSFLPTDGGRTVRLKTFGVTTLHGGDSFIKAGQFSTAVHEYTHRLQHVLPELDGYFQDMHGRRTGGDPLKRLRDLFPGHGYGREEVTREDKYIHPYQGRIYSGRGHPYLGKYGALEVMTMAFEDALGGDPAALVKLVEKDRGMFNLVIGVLFKYVP